MALHPSARRVQDELTRLGIPAQIVELEESTRSAAQAAEAVGCDIGQIAKSLVFRSALTGKPILVITSGANRVDEAAFGQRIGDSIERAEPDFVRNATGFAIGGVPPVGHTSPIEIYFDEDLLRHPTIWAAGGTPRALFEVDPRRLLSASRATPTRVT
ncbi:MAG TPA: YbaK/EbsC family protein [Anaerolineales bacterium]|nr:YbaK/EbsC family protein [Anaerolineales bacterium]